MNNDWARSSKKPFSENCRKPSRSVAGRAAVTVGRGRVQFKAAV
jgi:hypothetical protein